MINIAYVLVVPATLGYFGYVTDVSEGEGWVRRRWLTSSRASGICVARGGETPSLSFRERSSEEEEDCERVYITGNAGQEITAASSSRMNVSYVSDGVQSLLGSSSIFMPCLHRYRPMSLSPAIQCRSSFKLCFRLSPSLILSGPQTSLLFRLLLLPCLEPLAVVLIIIRR